MNPPFNDPARHRGSPDSARHSAHVATATTLESWAHAARRVLKSGGVLSLIWRADGLGEVLAALGRGFGSLALLPVHGRQDQPAIRVLVRAIKGGRAPLAIHPGLALNDACGIPTPEAEAVLAGRDELSLARR
jgi:tRNA1(Val) A37 N6-methylase TrmN6